MFNRAKPADAPSFVETRTIRVRNGLDELSMTFAEKSPAKLQAIPAQGQADCANVALTFGGDHFLRGYTYVGAMEKGELHSLETIEDGELRGTKAMLVPVPNAARCLPAPRDAAGLEQPIRCNWDRNRTLDHYVFGAYTGTRQALKSKVAALASPGASETLRHANGDAINELRGSYAFPAHHIFSGFTYQGTISAGQLHDAQGKLVAQPGAGALRQIPARDGQILACPFNLGKPLSRELYIAWKEQQAAAQTELKAFEDAHDYPGAPGLVKGLFPAAPKAAEAPAEPPSRAIEVTRSVGRKLWHGVPIAFTLAFMAGGAFFIYFLGRGNGPQRALRGTHPTWTNDKATHVLNYGIAPLTGVIFGLVGGAMALCLRHACFAGLQPQPKSKIVDIEAAELNTAPHSIAVGSLKA